MTDQNGEPVRPRPKRLRIYQLTGFEAATDADVLEAIILNARVALRDWEDCTPGHVVAALYSILDHALELTPFVGVAEDWADVIAERQEYNARKNAEFLICDDDPEIAKERPN